MATTDSSADGGHLVVSESITVLCDFHLGIGRDPVIGERDPFELFVHDEELARLIDTLRERASAEGVANRLVLLGDIFDFPRARSALVQAGVSDLEQLDCFVLTRVAHGHPSLFAALGRYLAAGMPIDIVPGNHDLALMRPSIHAHLRALLLTAGTAGPAAAHVRTHPWILYLPRILYAEHGQQYHDINSYPALLDLQGEEPEMPERPIGAAFDEYIAALARTMYLVNGAGLTVSSVMRRALRPAALPTTLRFHLGFVWALTRELLLPPQLSRRARRRTYREDRVRACSAEIGLPVETLFAIDGLAEDIAAGLRRRLLQMFLRSAKGAVRPRRAGMSSRGRASAENRQPDLPTIARRIHHLLSERGHDVPCYIFGHTHRAECVALTGDRAAPHYLNPGSWLAEPGSDLAREAPFSFVEVRQDQSSGTWTGRLMWWDDAASRIRPLVQRPALFDPACASTTFD